MTRSKISRSTAAAPITQHQHRITRRFSDATGDADSAGRPEGASPVERCGQLLACSRKANKISPVRSHPQAHKLHAAPCACSIVLDPSEHWASDGASRKRWGAALGSSMKGQALRPPGGGSPSPCRHYNAFLPENIVPEARSGLRPNSGERSQIQLPNSNGIRRRH